MDVEDMALPQGFDPGVASAVVLSKKIRLLLFLERGRESFTERQEHLAVKVLTEAGFKHARVKVRFRDKTELVDLRARSISPDGTVRVLKRDEIQEDKERSGDDKKQEWRVFQVPRVEVGSVVEFGYTVRTPRLSGLEWELISGPEPILRYELEILCSESIRYALRAYNVRESFRRSKDGDIVRLSLALDALVTWAEDSPVSGKVYEAEFKRTSSRAPADALNRLAYAARLTAAGDLHVDYALLREGEEAIWTAFHSAKVKKKEKIRENAEAVVSARGAGARLEEHEPYRCDRARGVCTRKLRFVVPAYATAVGDRLSVPLTIVTGGFQDLFQKEERSHDVVFRRGDVTEDVLELSIPEGFVVAEAPKPEKLSAGGFEYELHVEQGPGKVMVRRTLRRKAGLYKKKGYAEMRKVVRAYASARQKAIVLQRSPQEPAASP